MSEKSEVSEKNKSSTSVEQGKKQDKKQHKKSSGEKSLKSKSSRSKISKDEYSSIGEGLQEMISSPETVTGKEYNIRQDEIIYQGAGSIINKNKVVNGNIYITNKALIFSSRQVRPSFYVELLWNKITEIKKMHRRGYDKSVIIVQESVVVIFTALKDRDSFLKFANLILKAQNPNCPTYGFLAKNDEAEVVWKINVLKAPHVLEDTVTMKFSKIFQKFKKGDILNDMATAGGALEYAASNWKPYDGLSRNVSFTQPMLNPPSVSSNQSLRKSGNAFVLESTYSFSRISAPNFLQMQLQFYCREDGENSQLRGAFNLEWNKEITDKEFVEAAVIRMARMYFYYLKSIMCGEKFNESLYEGKWRLHQPYVLSIIALVITLLSIIVFPADTNWYSIMSGFIMVVFFFLF